MDDDLTTGIQADDDGSKKKKKKKSKSKGTKKKKSKTNKTFGDTGADLTTGTQMDLTTGTQMDLTTGGGTECDFGSAAGKKSDLTTGIETTETTTTQSSMMGVADEPKKSKEPINKSKERRSVSKKKSAAKKPSSSLKKGGSKEKPQPAGKKSSGTKMKNSKKKKGGSKAKKKGGWKSRLLGVFSNPAFDKYKKKLGQAFLSTDELDEEGDGEDETDEPDDPIYQDTEHRPDLQLVTTNNTNNGKIFDKGRPFWKEKKEGKEGERPGKKAYSLLLFDVVDKKVSVKELTMAPPASQLDPYEDIASLSQRDEFYFPDDTIKGNTIHAIMGTLEDLEELRKEKSYLRKCGEDGKKLKFTAPTKVNIYRRYRLNEPGRTEPFVKSKPGKCKRLKKRILYVTHSSSDTSISSKDDAKCGGKPSAVSPGAKTCLPAAASTPTKKKK